MLIDRLPLATATAIASALVALSAVVALVLVLRRHRTTVPARPIAFILCALFLAGVGPVLSSAFGAWAGAGAAAPALVAAAAGVFRLCSRPEYRPVPREDEGSRLKLFEAALSVCGDGVAISTANSNEGVRLVYSNAAFERLTGYSNDEALGLSPSVLADEPADLDEIRQAFRGTEAVRVELAGRRKDGSRVWAEWQVVPVINSKGRHTHTVAVLRDVTGRRDAERALRESEARFRSLFEQAADGIFVFDQQGQILDVNRQACQSLGYARGELTTFNMDKLGLKRAGSDLRVGETSTAGMTCRRKDGGTLAVDVRYAVIETDGHRVNLAMLRDVSRRRRAEQALREREELLRSVIAHIPCGVFWKDRDLVYLGCNEQVARDFGQAGPAQVIGRDDFHITHLRSEATLYRSYDVQVIETGQPVLNVEQQYTRPDGSGATLLTSKVPLRDARGQVVGVLGVYQDITARKRLEEQLRQSQKLEAVGRLAGGIAHDFNNLLTIIRGNALLLRSSAADAEAATLFDDLILASDRATALVRQLLVFSRRQPGKPEVMDWNEVVTAMSGLLRRVLGEHISIDTPLAADPVTLSADRSHLEQVVMNLAVNARDAMPGGGKLTIRTGTAWRETPDGTRRFARLTISDTGTGMTDEVKTRIFEPFFTTKGPDHGTGLGLATVFGIVQQAGGHVEVESAPGAGTTLHVDMPWRDGSPSGLVRTPAPLVGRDQRAGRSLSVLLLDDQDAIRTFVRLALRTRGHSVSEAANGEAALELARNNQFDVLVTDLSMPGMDGRELAARVREIQPGIGVVLMSGYAPDAGKDEQLGGTVFLQKPFAPAELNEALNKVLRRLGREPVPAGGTSHTDPPVGSLARV